MRVGRIGLLIMTGSLPTCRLEVQYLLKTHNLVGRKAVALEIMILADPELKILIAADCT